MVELAEKLKELERLRSKKERNNNDFEAIENIKEARKMIKMHEKTIADCKKHIAEKQKQIAEQQKQIAEQQKHIANVESIIANLRCPYDEKDKEYDQLIANKEIEIAKIMETQGISDYQSGGVKMTATVRHFDNMDDFNYADEKKKFQTDEELISQVIESHPEMITVKRSINLNKLRNAIKKGVFQIVDGRIITDDGEALAIDLVKKEKYQLNTEFTGED